MTNKIVKYVPDNSWMGKDYVGVDSSKFSGMSLWDLHQAIFDIVWTNKSDITSMRNCYIEDGKWFMHLYEDDVEFMETGLNEIEVSDDDPILSRLEMTSEDEIKRTARYRMSREYDNFSREEGYWSNKMYAGFYPYGKYDRLREEALDGNCVYMFLDFSKDVAYYIKELVAIVKKHKDYFFSYNYNDIMEVIDMYVDGVKKDLRKLRNE